ncbi:MAG: UbiA family prenyltransferase [Promethearchaeota archaeon]|jgi:4-hydroxybenzoate polyprenyltransferase
MFKDKVFGFFRLIRIGVSLFGCIALFVAGILADDLRGSQFEYLIAFFIVLISAAGSFAINDFYDYEVDKTNKRTDRPLALGLISKRTAFLTAIVSLIIVLVLTITLNLATMILVFLSLAIFYFYSMGLKKKLISKNILVALSYLSTTFLGSLIVDSYLEPIIIYFGIMGFIVGLANEIMFDIADVRGDNEQGIQTISTRFGVKKAAQTSVILYIIIILLDPLPFILNIDQRLYLDYLFLFLILVPVISYIFLSRSLLKNQSKENVLKLKTLVFVVMQFGTISYLIGVLV